MKTLEEQSLSIPFYGDTLYLVEHQGQPCTPMKPIVEAMGLAWQPQHKKFQDNPGRWGITLMVIQLPSDIQKREVLLMPIRKLFGWMMTISPNRVKPEIRDKVIQYQNECDDILWEHWSQKNNMLSGIEVKKAGKIVSLKNLEIVCEHRRTSSAAILYFFLQNENSDLSDNGWFRISSRALSEQIDFSHTGIAIALNYLYEMNLIYKDTEVGRHFPFFYKVNHEVLNQKLRQHQLPVIKQLLN